MESVNRSQAPQRLCELSQVAHLHGLGPTAWVAVRDRRPFLQGLHKKEQKKTKQVWKELKTSTRVFISAQGNVGKREIHRVTLWKTLLMDFRVYRLIL